MPSRYGGNRETGAHYSIGLIWQNDLRAGRFGSISGIDYRGRSIVIFLYGLSVPSDSAAIAMDDAEQQQLYEGLVRLLRSRGVVCAITSGLACVHYGIAETTQDCDLLCHTTSFHVLLEVLSQTTIAGVAAHYRGNISPPLDARWHRGGWTSHFQWSAIPENVTLDVFGHAIRESSPWTNELVGLYASPHTVAEMKRTNRDKDWGFITALGVRMLEAGDDRGWLHIFEVDTLSQLLSQQECPSAMADQRPALRLAQEKDRRVAGALNAERKLWEELDRQRIRLMERSLRPYVTMVRSERAGHNLSLDDEHKLRIRCAEAKLPFSPLTDHGVSRLIADAKGKLIEEGLLPAEALTWLPNVEPYFAWLNS